MGRRAQQEFKGGHAQCGGRGGARRDADVDADSCLEGSSKRGDGEQDGSHSGQKSKAGTWSPPLAAGAMNG